MANEEQVALLRQGSQVWNDWRERNPYVQIDLSTVDLSGANLHAANLRTAKLIATNLCNANLCDANLVNADLSGANLRDANLSGANLYAANLRAANLNAANLRAANLNEADLRLAKVRDTNLCFANLRAANLSEVDLIAANLSSADLIAANLIATKLRDVNLSEAKLSAANLRTANLCFANLHAANLIGAQVLGTNFSNAVLTGACIQDWQIGNSTSLEGVQCAYIFRTYDTQKQKFSGRLPVDPESTFAPGEFTQRFQIIASALETIDITFTEGIDWQAFFQSFQELLASHPEEEISVQGMERKGDAFVVRLEVGAEVDKAVIETETNQRYASQLAAFEAQYEARLQLEGKRLEDAQRTIEAERQRNTQLIEVMGVMAQNQGSKYDMRGAQFAGGFAETVQGNQIGGVINNYGQDADDIIRLVTSLREIAQHFPEAQKDEVLMELDDLATDLNKPEKPEPKRIGKRLKRLIAAGTAAATIASGAATFSGDITEFTGNVLELGEKIGLTRQEIAPDQATP